MTHNAFIRSLAQRLEIDEDQTSTMADQFVDTIVREVQLHGQVSIQGFGNFEIKEKAERKMFNPTTKTYKVIPSKRVLGFKMTAKLKNRINNL